VFLCEDATDYVAVTSLAFRAAGSGIDLLALHTLLMIRLEFIVLVAELRQRAR
jgi:hypothetical protein